ncbi:hypothetical protein FJ930_13060 [Mesorhizobium sp. B2-4-15]|nr:hypothetical protein FJ930_13060 [Mesorhizobium sp. B2-4-15]
MGRLNFAEELHLASDRTAEMSGADLRALLRRAALMLRNVSVGLDVEPAIEAALEGVAAEMRLSRPQLLQSIVTQWLFANAYLPYYESNERDHSGDGTS